jgi:type IV pilus assembly protein PilE
MERFQKGVTLMELMIVVVIIGILASIAYPSYRAQVMRSHRSDAKVALERAAQTLERCFTNSNPKGYGACPAPNAGSDNGYYAIAVNIPAAPADQAFTLTATAVGGQLQDAQCRSFTLTDTNVRNAKTSANVDNRNACWGR